MKVLILVLLNLIGLSMTAINIWGIVEAVQVIGGIGEATLGSEHFFPLVYSILGVMFTLVITFLLNLMVTRLKLNTRRIREMSNNNNNNQR